MTPISVVCSWSDFWILNAAHAATMLFRARQRFARGQS